MLVEDINDQLKLVKGLNKKERRAEKKFLKERAASLAKYLRGRVLAGDESNCEEQLVFMYDICVLTAMKWMKNDDLNGSLYQREVI